MAKKARGAKSSPKRESYRHGDLKRALIEAGVALAREGGPEAVVLREATRRAGVVPNAAYRHFASRDDLLEAVRSAALAALAAAMERALEVELLSISAIHRPDTARGGRAFAAPTAADIARARLRAVGAGYLRFAREQTGLFRTAFTSAQNVREREPNPERAGPGGLNPFQLLSMALDELMRSGVLAKDQRENAEYIAWSSVHGMAMLGLDGPLARISAAEYGALGQRLVKMVERGLDFGREAY